MELNRRRFIRSGLGAGALAAMHNSCSAADSRKAGIARLDEAAAAPILKLSSVKSPVKIASVELLRDKKNHFVRTRSTIWKKPSASPTPCRFRFPAESRKPAFAVSAG